MKDNNVKEQLDSSGLAVTLRVSETGQELNLRFGKGERLKRVSAVVGQYALEGAIRLVDVDSPSGKPNLTVVVDLGGNLDDLNRELKTAKAKLRQVAAAEPVEVGKALDAGAKVDLPSHSPELNEPPKPDGDAPATSSALTPAVEEAPPPAPPAETPGPTTPVTPATPVAETPKPSKGGKSK